MIILALCWTSEIAILSTTSSVISLKAMAILLVLVDTTIHYPMGDNWDKFVHDHLKQLWYIWVDIPTRMRRNHVVGLTNCNIFKNKYYLFVWSVEYLDLRDIWHSDQELLGFWSNQHRRCPFVEQDQLALREMNVNIGWRSFARVLGEC